MANKKVPITFSATMEVKDLLQSVEQIKKKMQDIKLPAETARGLTNTVALAQRSLERFQEVSSKPIVTKTDLKDFNKAYEQAEKDYNKLFEQIQKIQGQSGKFKIGDVLSGKQLQSYKTIQSAVNKITESTKRTSTEYQKANQKLAQRKNLLKEVKDKQDSLNKAQQNADAADISASKLKTKIETARARGEDQAVISAMEEELTKQNNLVEKYLDEAVALTEEIDSYRKKVKTKNDDGTVTESFGETVDEAIERIEKEADSAQRAVDRVSSGVAGFNVQIKELKKNEDVTKLFESFHIDIDEIKNAQQLRDAINSIESQGISEAEAGLENAQRTLASFERSLSGAAAGVDTLNDKFQELEEASRDFGIVGQRALSFFTYSNLGNIFGSIVSDARQAVTDLDKVMTETAVVTDFSVGDMWEKLPEYTKLANELGASTLGAYETTTLFYQQGRVKI